MHLIPNVHRSPLSQLAVRVHPFDWVEFYVVITLSYVTKRTTLIPKQDKQLIPAHLRVNVFFEARRHFFKTNFADIFLFCSAVGLLLLYFTSSTSMKFPIVPLVPTSFAYILQWWDMSVRPSTTILTIITDRVITAIQQCTNSLCSASSSLCLILPGASKTLHSKPSLCASSL